MGLVNAPTKQHEFASNSTAFFGNYAQHIFGQEEYNYNIGSQNQLGEGK